MVVGWSAGRCSHQQAISAPPPKPLLSSTHHRVDRALYITPVLCGSSQRKLRRASSSSVHFIVSSPNLATSLVFGRSDEHEARLHERVAHVELLREREMEHVVT